MCTQQIEYLNTEMNISQGNIFKYFIYFNNKFKKPIDY